MKKTDFRDNWNAFLQWKGWRTAGFFCQKIWNQLIHWQGWKSLFAIPYPLVLAMCVVCALGLVWVFLNDLTEWVPAYFLYALSAYTLTALCIKLPGTLGSGKRWLFRHPKVTSFLQDKELRFKLGLYLEQFINVAYGAFKITAGVMIGSAWIGCDGIYNMTQALIQLFQILRRKRTGSLQQQWKSYRFCGVLILLMHLTLVGIVFQMVNWNRAKEQGEIMVITTAFFAFYKVITGFISIAKDRKHLRPVDSSIRMLNLAQAFFAIFSLQASMFHTFGTGEHWEHQMNILTGCTVCLLIVSIGIYMVRRGNREIKQLQEKYNEE